MSSSSLQSPPTALPAASNCSKSMCERPRPWKKTMRASASAPACLRAAARPIAKIATDLRRQVPPHPMGDVVRVGGRGTSRRIVGKEKDNWTGEEYRKYNESRKEAAKNVYISVGRGTKKIRLGDIAETKGRPSGKGLYIETNRGTGRRKVE